MRVWWSLILLVLVLVGATRAGAEPTPSVSPTSSVRIPRPAPPAPQVSAHRTSLPDLFDLPYSRWDFVAVGGGGAYLFNVQLHLFTYHWRHVRLTAFETMFGVNGLEGSFDFHLGPTIGFGGHHGPRQSLSHWFVLGTFYGQMHPIIMFRVQTLYRGLFLMAGYEFRVHFGRRLNWLFGLRLFAAGSPLGRNRTLPCSCNENELLCSCDPDPDDPIRLPITFGLTAFFGY